MEKEIFKSSLGKNLMLLGMVLLSGCSTFERAQEANVLERRVASLNRTISGLKEDQVHKEKRLEKKEKEIQDLLVENTYLREMLDNEKISRQNLNDKIQIYENQLSKKNKTIQQVKQEKEKELSELEKAKRDLEESLSKELQEYQAKLEMTERGLVITFLAEIFFDSGKAEIKEVAKPSLQKVGTVLRGHAIDSKVAVEGHTDNVPIRWSKWDSNWELSTARSLAVLHYFVDEAQISPMRLSAVGHGEYQPVQPNATEPGRQQNRRVEIVILPSKEIKKVKPNI